MSYSSISLGLRKIVYQVFCGRLERANSKEHAGTVLKRMLQIDWNAYQKDLGVTHIYLLGLWQNQGEIVVSHEDDVDISADFDRCPSPFAITDHQMVNPLLGNEQELISLIEVLHASKLEVLVDFVPNHTGLKHAWVTSNPEYYKKSADGQMRTAFSGDVYELDYSNNELSQEMTTVLRYIERLGVDGVRVDMAHLIPVSYWKNSITQIKELRSEFVFIAEAYSPTVFDLSIQQELINVGFEAIYDEPLYRNMKHISNGRPLSDIVGHINHVLSQTPAHWVHYISNHDDTFPFEQNQVDIWQAFFLMLPGWHLVYNGTLQGFGGRLAHHRVALLADLHNQTSSLSRELQAWFEWVHAEQPVLESASLVNDEVCELHCSVNGIARTCTFDFIHTTYKVN